MTERSADLPHMTGAGVAPVKIPEIDKLVDRYVSARDTRMDCTTREVEAKSALIAALHENAAKLVKLSDGEIVYRHDDLVVTLKTGKEKLKVRTVELDPNE